MFGVFLLNINPDITVIIYRDRDGFVQQRDTNNENRAKDPKPLQTKCH